MRRPFPVLEEINAQEEFRAVTTTAAEFESVWSRARRTASRWIGALT
ncbi:DUF6881 domain-containing protein [Kibdelosporangium phytohabitans]